MDDHQSKRLSEIGKKWAAAMIANDADAIGSFMSDDWVIVSERDISDKEYFLSFVRNGRLTHTQFEMTGEPRIRGYGNSAVLTCRVKNTAQFDGQEFHADEWTTDLFVLIDGEWKCVLSHITPVNGDFEATSIDDPRD